MTPNPQPPPPPSTPQPSTPDYAVRLPDFEGPLEVLLRLIEKHEMEISRVALAAVADQFLQYVNTLAAPEPRLLAQFLVVAAKLLFIKSQALLPQPAVALPPAEDEEDVAAELVRRLEEYRAVQARAAQLRAREAQGWRSYPHPAPLHKPQFPASTPGLGLEGVSLAALVRLMNRRLQLTLPLSPPPTLIPHTITLEEMVATLQAQLSAQPHTPLSVWSLLDAAPDRPTIVITFMAVLELLRREHITTQQDAAFGDILITRAAGPELGVRG